MLKNVKHGCMFLAVSPEGVVSLWDNAAQGDPGDVRVLLDLTSEQLAILEEAKSAAVAMSALRGGRAS